MNRSNKTMMQVIPGGPWRVKGTSVFWIKTFFWIAGPADMAREQMNLDGRKLWPLP